MRRLRCTVFRRQSPTAQLSFPGLGPKDPRLYGPYFGPTAIVEKDLECRPCRKRSCDDPRCMLTITPDDVLAAAHRLLGDA